jgi:NADH:ubiquinone oxidoreductase subunit 3 (subunit A)
MITDSYNYVALFIFVLFAAFVPLSFLLTSWFLRPHKPSNPVKGTSYESAEQPIGRIKDVANEYLPFFAIFLPFEIISMVLLLWAVSARQLPPLTNVIMIGLPILAMTFAWLGYKMTVDKSV